MNNTAEAANWKNLEIVNNTGYTIERIYIGGGDCLGDNVLPNSSSHTIRYNADVRYWDITIVLRGGSSYGYNCDLSGAWRITFFQNNKGSFSVSKN